MLSPGITRALSSTVYAILLNMPVYMGIDIGGTNMRAALYEGDDQSPNKYNKLPTHLDESTPFDQLVRLIESVWPVEGTLDAIGIASPGPLNPYTGVIYMAPNIHGWQDFPLVDLLTDKFNVPIFLDNDANLAGYAEWKFGAGRGHNHMIYMTISTGVGGGVIINGELLHGTVGIAAELGHVTVLPDGPMCGCGQKGHLEAVAAGPAIARYVRAEIARGESSILADLSEFTTKEIAEAARNGDKLAKKAFDRAGLFIGRKLADYLHIFNPSAVVIGGGVSNAGSLILDPIQSAIKQYAFSTHYYEDLVISAAQLGDEAGLLGAYALARERCG